MTRGRYIPRMSSHTSPATKHATESRGLARRLRPDLPVFIGLATAGVVLSHLSPGGAPTSGANLLWSLWLVAAILACAFRAMAHADALAERFGEPLGTLILTISAITIEVAAVCAVMLGEGGNPTVARDTMFSVLMIILNLLAGLAMLLGGRRRLEQDFNAQSASAYLPLLVALASITLILPRFTTSREGGWMSDPMELFVGVSSFVIYSLFLLMQTTKHRVFFAHHGASERAADDHGSTHAAAALHHGPGAGFSGVMLVLSLLAVVGIAEGLAGRVSTLLAAVHAPSALGGVFIAALVLAPEGLASLKAAGRDDMQRSINILLGSALATIGLTVPAVLAIRFFTGISPELGLDAPYIVLLMTTFLVSAIGFGRGKVHAMQGVVHLLLFVAWIVTILDEAGIGG